MDSKPEYLKLPIIVDIVSLFLYHYREVAK